MLQTEGTDMLASILIRLNSVSILTRQMIHSFSILALLCYVFHALTKAYTWMIHIIIKAMNVGNMNHVYSLTLFLSTGK